MRKQFFDIKSNMLKGRIINILFTVTTILLLFFNLPYAEAGGLQQYDTPSTPPQTQQTPKAPAAVPPASQPTPAPRTVPASPTTSTSTLSSASPQASASQATVPAYWTGDGGKGMRLAVLEPTGKGIPENEKWMLSLIQSSITGDFNRYSAITIIDRLNLEKILAEQTESMSGNYSDEDYIRIGHLTNSRYILAGSVSKTANNYIMELAVTDAETGERKVSYPPKPVSILALENLSAIREATADLLGQLGVQLTALSLQELKTSVNTAQIQAETALARGIMAQRQGTEVAALSYYFQAATINPSLMEASSRASILSANISSGNIGEDVRNDIQWRKDWVARLTETEQYFANYNRTESMPYTLYYSDEIITGAVNYQTETVTLGIKTYLHSTDIWAFSFSRVLNAIYDGLEGTKRKAVWGLDNWPQQGVTNLKPFDRQTKTFSIVAELLNSRNQVIGRQTFQMEGYWQLNLNNRPITVIVSPDVQKIVNFTNVKANDITDSLTIRIVSVNGTPAETAARNGVLQIIALPKAQYEYYSSFQISGGVIRKYTGNDSTLVIDKIWSIPASSITAIGNEAFQYSPLTSFTIPDNVTSIGDHAFDGCQLTSIVIPRGVTSIGAYAFAYNKLTSVTIPNSVTSIGASAFSCNQLTRVTIPNSVTAIGRSAFDVNRLTTVTIPNSITSISAFAFAHNNLTSVALPNSVKTISGSAFFYNKLTSVTIPDSVTTIGGSAFGENPISSVIIGANVDLTGFTDTFENSAWNERGLMFSGFYKYNGKKAGRYIYAGSKWSYSPQ